MMSKFFTRMFVLFATLLTGVSLQAQVTTGTFVGSVSSEKGEPLVGATVVALHTTSGTRYGATANEDGRFVIPNVRVGGPYTVTVSFIGYKELTLNNLYVNLGQKLPLDLKLRDGDIELSGVEIVTERNGIMSDKRTGAATNISSEQLRALPTISRSAADFTRLTPASDGGSFGGRNDQFNNFSLDGTIFNNPFGLDAATPGGQSDAQPVSLDAIEQIQVSIAPYDVSQAGFTGAAVNAVTKSGTNEFKGTVFGFYRNQDMTGSKVAGTTVFQPKLGQLQSGFSFGGPLIKDKLFFFVNAELERRQDLGSSFKAARPGVSDGNTARVTAADLEAVSTALRNKFGYETGAYEGYTHNTNNQKGIIKLDWNISAAHKATFTYNFLDAFKEKPAHPSAIGRRGPDFTTLQFYNSGYRINNKINSFLFDLKSVVGTRFANKFQAGYTQFRDFRDPFSEPFPVVSIQKEGSRYIIAGHEPFSIHNKLNQRVFQINDKFDMYLGNHTVSIGAAYEQFSFDNSFNLNAYGGTFGDYASVQAFIDTVNNSAAFAAEVAAARAKFKNTPENDWAWARTNVGQISAYVQDEWQVNPKLTVTAGIRVDKPTYLNTVDLIKERLADPVQTCCYDPSITYYDETGAAVKLDHTQLPSTKPLVSPRLGFNYDVKGDRTLQIRGGSGLFTGRFPFVWVGNQVANPNFFFYCITDPDFKFPQVWRSNLGYDQKLPNGLILSADFIYTKDINAMMVRNFGLATPRGTLNAPGDNRPVYRAADRATVFGGPTNAYVFSNTNVGSSTNLTLQVQKNWRNGMFGSLGYNYGLARDASSIEAEISSDAYDRNPAYGNVNAAVAAPSAYGNLHRVVGSFSKRFAYGTTVGNVKKYNTTVSGFFQYAKGGRFSYTYAGDINNDGSGNNDLMFIPTDAQLDQMAFSGNAAAQAAQKAAFKAFIEQDAYLSANRGKVVEKYALLSPWYNNWDVRVLQDINFKVGQKVNTVQFSLDLLNAGNLISSNWGVRQLPTNTQPVGVSVDGSGRPTYSFDTQLKNTFVNDFSLLSRWQLQVGARYIF